MTDNQKGRIFVHLCVLGGNVAGGALLWPTIGWRGLVGLWLLAFAHRLLDKVDSVFPPNE